MLKAGLKTAYSNDPRDWLLTEDAPGLAAGQSEILAGQQSEPTRAVVSANQGQMFRAMIVEVLPGEDGQVEVLAVEDNPKVHSADAAAPPATSADAPALLNNDSPTWDGVVIVGSEVSDTQNPGRIDHRIEGPAIPGAVRYIAEWASSIAAADWQAAADSASPAFDGPMTTDADISIRVAAAGPVLRGPWVYFRTQIDVINGGKTVAIPDPAAAL